jgi:hypothetical protein
MLRCLFVRGFFVAVTTGYFAETFRRGIFVGVDSGWNGFFRCRRRSMLACFDAGAILLNEDLRLVKIFVGVNVRFFFLLRGFAGFFLAGGFGDLLIVLLLGAARRGEKRNRRAEKCSGTQADWLCKAPRG